MRGPRRTFWGQGFHHCKVSFFFAHADKVDTLFLHSVRGNESSSVYNFMDMLARLYRLDSFATVRRESSAVCNCMDMLNILHGFIDLIDSSASMDSPKSSQVYKCSNKQKELLYFKLFAGTCARH